MTPNVSEDFGFESEFADGFAVGAGLFGSSGGCKFDVFNTEFVKSFGDFDFFGRIKEGIGELFPFSLWNTVSYMIANGEFTKVDSMMEKFDTRDKKSSARGRTRQLYFLTGGLIIRIVVWSESWLIRHMGVPIVPVCTV